MRMKVYLCSLAVLLSIGAVTAPYIVKSTLPKAKVAKLETISYTEYVYASGEISSADSKSICVDMPVVIEEIFADVGTQVSSGEVIATVNREKTAKSMMELNEYASIAALGAGTTVTDYKEIIALIPESIRSDCSGTVESVSAKSGSLVSSGSPVITLSGTEPLKVKANIGENKISKISLNQSVIISGSAFGEKSYTGYVESIANSATKQYVGTSEETVIPIEVVFDQADDAVKSGYSADIKICVSQMRDISVAPYESVYTDEIGDYVYIFENGTAQQKYITTGVEIPEGVEILSGISSSDTIIYSESELCDGDYVALQIKN